MGLNPFSMRQFTRMPQPPPISYYGGGSSQPSQTLYTPILPQMYAKENNPNYVYQPTGSNVSAFLQHVLYQAWAEQGKMPQKLQEEYEQYKKNRYGNTR